MRPCDVPPDAGSDGGSAKLRLVAAAGMAWNAAPLRVPPGDGTGSGGDTGSGATSAQAPRPASATSSTPSTALSDDATTIHSWRSRSYSTRCNVSEGRPVTCAVEVVGAAEPRRSKDRIGL